MMRIMIKDSEADGEMGRGGQFEMISEGWRAVGRVEMDDEFV
jgi:hypothetical protein